jgi:aminopeptidase N
MEVFDVTSSGKPVKYVHGDNAVIIESSTTFRKDDTVTVTIKYGGEPIDGLVIGKNKFGDRTFFGDNWPDRGRNWLPAIDHPSDKAKVDFIITAPAHYEVVATGKLVSEKPISRNRKEHHWKENTDVAIKVVTLGAAEFSIKESDVINGVPVSTWVFPQNQQAGFDDFSVAPQVFRFMQDFIGQYPYEKLAHVQSQTRFGGLENASNIFYFENSVNGKRQREGLIAHETAHQWFGNSLTENDWYHVWLSEGFATYFAALYLGTVHGDARFSREMAEARQEVIKSNNKKPGAIIDTTFTDMMDVLSTNTYQKASWFLHMLREKVGYAPFQEGIREYYRRYRDGNVMTTDFLKVMELVSRQELDGFFKLWLYQPGLPRVSGEWGYLKKNTRLRLRYSGFSLPGGTAIEAALVFADGTRQVVQIPLSAANNELVIPSGKKPTAVILDPETKFLFEGEIKEKR